MYVKRTLYFLLKVIEENFLYRKIRFIQAVILLGRGIQSCVISMTSLFWFTGSPNIHREKYSHMLAFSLVGFKFAKATSDTNLPI